MERTVSKDGTSIAYQRSDVGAEGGAAIVFVGGAFNLRDTCLPIAELLAPEGIATVVYDRRARGDSGDIRPYAIEREIDDLAAVIDLVGGRASVFGFSSGGVLALAAAAAGVGVDRVFLYEAPFRFDPDARAQLDPGLPARLQALVDDGRPGDAVSLFQREGIGLPAEVVEQIKHAPFFPALEAIAQSVVYDATITTTLAVPTREMVAVTTPVTVMRGERTWPLLESAAEELVRLLPGARLEVIPGAADHGLPAEPLAAHLRAALAR
ncbi:alpha/beta hydrolase [Herbiconiux moechotypicola]|nr:alpha/beta hydrolase [Herbiconiux moechotypicola]MCS5729118.1 alpha/beta hydrolase [Herbiconiux moechotypicola]